MGTVIQERLEITNRLQDLKMLQEWVLTVSERLQLSQRTAFNLDLVLCEAVTNIINYAYQDQDIHQISIFLHANNKNLRLKINDDGIAFNPLAHAIEHNNTDLDTVAIGGRGIRLMKSLTKEQQYHYLSGNNILELVF